MLGVSADVCLLTYQQGTRKEDKLMMLQKKIGPENLPLKAVIALMGTADAATAAVLSRPAKDPRTGSISKSPGGGAQHISHCVQRSKTFTSTRLSVSFFCGIMYCFAVLMPLLSQSSYSAQTLSCFLSGAQYFTHHTLFGLVQFS